MQGATHRAGGVSAALLGFIGMQETGVVFDVEPVASLLVIYPFAIWGSTAPDLDHHPGSLWDEFKLVGKRSGNTLPSQDPVSRGISQILHISRKPRKMFPKKSFGHKMLGALDCKHRSWQTHSEFPIVVIGLFLWWILTQPSLTMTNYIFMLVSVGVLFGILSHLVLDGLTPEGLKCSTGMFVNRFLLNKKVLPEKIAIVPHIKPTEKGEPGFFSTGGVWEKKVVFNLLHTLNICLLLYIGFILAMPGASLPDMLTSIR